MRELMGKFIGAVLCRKLRLFAYWHSCNTYAALYYVVQHHSSSSTSTSTSTGTSISSKGGCGSSFLFSASLRPASLRITCDSQ
jgi:hypothetical protein